MSVEPPRPSPGRAALRVAACVSVVLAFGTEAEAQNAYQRECLRLINLLRSDPYRYAEEWYGTPRADMEAYFVAPDVRLPALQWNHRLANAAARHLQWCAANEVLSHYEIWDGVQTSEVERVILEGITPPAGGLPFSPGEILVFHPRNPDGTTTPDPQSWLRAWFNSLSHRRSLLDSTRHFAGISYQIGVRLDEFGSRIEGTYAGMLTFAAAPEVVNQIDPYHYPGPFSVEVYPVESFWAACVREQQTLPAPPLEKFWVNHPQLGALYIPTAYHDAPHWVYQTRLGWLFAHQRHWRWDPAASLRYQSAPLGSLEWFTVTGLYRASWESSELMPVLHRAAAPAPGSDSLWLYRPEGSANPLPVGWLYAGALPYLWSATLQRWYYLSDDWLYAYDEARWLRL